MHIKLTLFDRNLAEFRTGIAQKDIMLAKGRKRRKRREEFDSLRSFRFRSKPARTHKTFRSHLGPNDSSPVFDLSSRLVVRGQRAQSPLARRVSPHRTHHCRRNVPPAKCTGLCVVTDLATLIKSQAPLKAHRLPFPRSFS